MGSRSRHFQARRIVFNLMLTHGFLRLSPIQANLQPAFRCRSASVRTTTLSWLRNTSYWNSSGIPFRSVAHFLNRTEEMINLEKEVELPKSNFGAHTGPGYQQSDHC